MRRLAGMVLLLSCAILAADQPKSDYAKANAKPLEGYIVLLRLRHDLFLRWKDTGKWPDDPAANEALKLHGAYWNEQMRRGKAILAGGMKGDFWDNVALIILDVSTEEEAKQLVANDPAVKAYVFQAQVRPFDIQWISTKY